MLDRKLQKFILEELKITYPEPRDYTEIPGYSDHEYFIANLYYLAEHGLIDVPGPWYPFDNSAGVENCLASITANGLDFLEDDGGLRAILNIVTIKFDPEDIKKAFVIRIEALECSNEDKSKYKDIIKELPAEVLKTISQRLINVGIDNLPNLIKFIENIVC